MNPLSNRPEKRRLQRLFASENWRKRLDKGILKSRHLRSPGDDGRRSYLGEAATRWTVTYAYPRTDIPDQDSPPGWDEIPGA